MKLDASSAIPTETSCQLQQISNTVTLITGLYRKELCINICSTLRHVLSSLEVIWNSEADFVSDGVQRINGEQLAFAQEHLTKSHQAENEWQTPLLLK